MSSSARRGPHQASSEISDISDISEISTPDTDAPLLTAEQVAARLAVEPSWVYRAARTGTLPAIRVGRWVRFRHHDLEQFIDAGGTDDDYVA